MNDQVKFITIFNEIDGHMTVIESNSHMTIVYWAHHSSLWKCKLPAGSITNSGKTPRQWNRKAQDNFLKKDI